MSLSLRSLASFVLASTLTGALGCGSADTGDSETSAITEIPSDAEGFRDIFYTYLKKENGYSDADVQKLIFLPSKTDLAPPVSAGAGNHPISGYDEHFAERRPSALYDHGVETPFRELADLESALKERGPITIVVIQGIFGEFFARPPFEELLAKGPSTALGKTWAERLKSHGSPDDTRDAMYSLTALGDETYPLGDLVDAASIDDEDGNPLVNVLFMKAKAGSLETIGKIEDRTAPYLRRMTKLFNVLGTPDRFYLLGYSRGTMMALNVLSSATSDVGQYPWSKNVAGVVTLGGVVYGTQLADPLLDPEKPLGELVTSVEALTGALVSCSPDDSATERAEKIRVNTETWKAAAGKVDDLVARLPRHAELELEDIGRPTPDFGDLLRTLQRLLFNDLLQLDQPVSEYCENVDRWKRLATDLIDGATELTTPSRLEWWRTHTVPSDIPYFSIAGTMGDASTKGDVWPLNMNDVAYTPGSVDYRNLRTSFYDIYKSTGLMLNDSQVAYTRARFWPEVHGALNPQQGPLDARFVALFGEDHWGFALPRVIEEASGASSPFPRTAMLKALATYLALAE